MRKMVSLLFLFIFLIGFNLQVEAANTNILEKEQIELQISETYQIEILNEIDYAKIEYFSENSEVAEVSGTGLITAKEIGSTMVTIVCDGNEATLYVAVFKKANYLNLLTESDVTLTEGEEYKILASTDGSKPITYISENENIASVSKDGLITANNCGQTNVVLKIDGINKCVSVNVKGKIEELILTKNDFNIPLGQIEQIEIVSNLEGNTINYISNNEEVARVSEDGIISTHKVGSAVIILMIDKKMVANCNVDVVEVPITEIILKNESVNLVVGDTYQIEYTYKPNNATTNVTFKSLNEDICTVSESGEIRAFASGKATIEIIADDIKETLEVNVSSKAEPKNNRGLIICLSVGMILILIITISTLIYLKKRKKSNNLK